MQHCCHHGNHQGGHESDSRGYGKKREGETKRDQGRARDRRRGKGGESQEKKTNRGNGGEKQKGGQSFI